MSQDSGGDTHVTKTELFTYVIFTPNDQMATASRDKRKLRRQLEMTNATVAFESPSGINSFYPKTHTQEDLWASLNKSTVTLAIGPAGTGKTLCALWWGCSALQQRHLNKIVYVRSDVGCQFQRGRGALPGDADAKFAPLLGPVLDNLNIISKSTGFAQYLISKKILEPILLEDVRGRSFNESLIIFDEAQNATPDQVKTVLSRVGEHSKIIVTGDTRQIDLGVFQTDNGLVDAWNRLAHLSEISRVQFGHKDIVRNGVIANILRAYDE
jgi:phosphate starvation-inducible PhoH-like protein